jgi:hypothetical protein
MRPDIANDFAFGRRYLDHMRIIVGRHLIAEAPAEEDMQRNTDLIVLRLDAVRIACRVRRDTYRGRYGEQFTIRAGRPNGTKTELAKVIEGYGDYILYGFGAPNADYLTAWALGDLRVFRLWLAQSTVRAGHLPGVERPNTDGSSTFRAFRYADMPPEFVKASHGLPLRETVAA